MNHRHAALCVLTFASLIGVRQARAGIHCTAVRELTHNNVVDHTEKVLRDEPTPSAALQNSEADIGDCHYSIDNISGTDNEYLLFVEYGDPQADGSGVANHAGFDASGNLHLAYVHGLLTCKIACTKN